jgi:hypothetical protein
MSRREKPMMGVTYGSAARTTGHGSGEAGPGGRGCIRRYEAINQAVKGSRLRAGHQARIVLEDLGSWCMGATRQRAPRHLDYRRGWGA